MNSVSPASVQYLSQDELRHPDGRQLFNPRSGSQRGTYTGLFPGGGAARSQHTEPDEVDKIKCKVLSVWNNMKYGEFVCRNYMGNDGRGYWFYLIISLVSLKMSRAVRF